MMSLEMDKRMKMSNELLEGVKVTIGVNEVKVLAWIQNRKRSSYWGWEKMTQGNLSIAINGAEHCALGLGKWSWLWRGAGVSQRKGDRREFNNIGEMRWSGRSWIYSLGSMDRPSITPGRNADEAWAPASEKRVQTARHRHAGRGEVGRGRWCGWLTLLCASHHYKSCPNRQY